MMLARPAYKLAINLIRDTPSLINGEIIEKFHRVTDQDTLAAVRLLSRDEEMEGIYREACDLLNEVFPKL